MKEKRDNFVEFWIGHNRTGKSVNLREQAIAYKKKHPKKKIIAFDPQNRFKDIADEFIFDENWEQYLVAKGNGLTISDTYFILDDYRALMEKDTTPKPFVRMLMQRNEYGLDFSLVCHNPKFILERVSYYTTHVNLFYSSGGDESFKSSGKIMNIETIMQCRKVINTYVTEYDKGEHKSVSKSGKNTFPFIRLDFEEEKLSLLNMPHAIVNGKEIKIKPKKKDEAIQKVKQEVEEESNENFIEDSAATDI